MELKTPNEWLETPEFEGVIVMDPDGWRYEGAPKWTDPITLDEFKRRLMECTVMIPSAATRSSVEEKE